MFWLKQAKNAPRRPPHGVAARGKQAAHCTVWMSSAGSLDVAPIHVRELAELGCRGLIAGEFPGQV